MPRHSVWATPHRIDPRLLLTASADQRCAALCWKQEVTAVMR
ncbi:MAG: hypothetical protein ACO3WN_06895 [Burkholderiaceae bacterium]